MFKNLYAIWLVPIYFSSGFAAAQIPSPASATPESTKTSSLTYRSAFEGYQSYAEEKISNWKVTNDTVERIGGWREYAKQAQQPANTPAQAIRAGEVVPKAKP